MLLIITAPQMVIGQADTYIIHGLLKNVAQNVEKVYLSHSNGKSQVIDSAEVINNAYTLKGTVVDGNVVTLLSYKFAGWPLREHSRVGFFLSPGTIMITHENDFDHIIFRGSPALLAFDSLQKAAATYNNDSLRNEQLYAMLIRKDPGSVLALYALKQSTAYGANIRPGIDMQLFGMLPQKIKETESAQYLYAQIQQVINFNTVVIPGAKAINFTMHDTAGRAVSLASYRGRYVLLDFWASWCGPCRGESPTLVAVYQRFHEKGFDILSISLDSKPDAWLQAIRTDHLNAWTQLINTDYTVNSVSNLYGVSGIPQNFLIDPDGKIIARSLRGEDLVKKLIEILKN